MALLISAGALLQCPFGAAPSVLSVLPIRFVQAGTPVATVMDHIPLVNVMPFGLCSCAANPMVAAATAAAMGVLTPAPCIPMTSMPWLPGAPTVRVGSEPALQAASRLLCQWGGTIDICAPAQFTTQVP